MFLDAQKLPQDAAIVVDVCIVGTGPAGLSLAESLRDYGCKICLVESGHVDASMAEPRDLSQVDIATDFVPMNAERWRRQAISGGMDFSVITPERRHRRFGGNACAWGIRIGQTDSVTPELGLRHVPLARADFESRDWMPDSGWPITYDQLVPFYKRAHSWLQMGPCEYDPDFWETPDTRALPLSETRIRSRVFQFSRAAVLLDDCRQRLDACDNVDIYLNATVVSVETNESASTATGVQCRCMNGLEFSIRSKVVVLAGGGVEAAQLLLLSTGVSPTGLGNDHDLVGRYFMDHPLVVGGELIPANRGLFNHTAFYDLRQVNGHPIMGHLTFSDETLRREPIPNLSSALFPRAKRYWTPESIKSLKSLLKFRPSQGSWSELAKHIRSVATGLPDIAESVIDKIQRKPNPFLANFSTGGWSEKQPRKEKSYYSFELVHQTEQLPNRENRIVLSEHRDPIGRRRPELRARWMPADIEALRRAHHAMATDIFQSGIGLFIPRWEEEDLPYVACIGASHHMGTTRMHQDPKRGVVDKNCQVHGVANLYISSSAVFPTGGYAGPTLTIVALSIRLADHIKAMLSRKPIVTQQAQTSMAATA